jgi:uncharacterized protein YaeQ
MIEKYTFDLQAPRIKKSKIILVKSDNETRSHVVLKLLGYILYYHPDLKVEVAASSHYQPDLLLEGDSQEPLLWIDCGYIAVRKAEKLSQKLRRTKFVIIKESKAEIESFRKLLARRDRAESMIEYLAFEKGFVEQIAAALKKINEVTLYEVMEEVIGIVVNDGVFESQLYRMKDG